MIISASRRTDIPAFYARWFIKRIRAGYCEVPNPFNRQQISRVSLSPEDVDVIVFWTRNPHPLFPYLTELDEGGYRYYFQYTLLGYPVQIDADAPPLEAALRTFADLAQRIGPEKVIWRYDPIVLSQATPPDYHREAYARLAEALAGSTRRSVISLMDDYPKIHKRLGEMERQGGRLLRVSPETEKGNLPNWVGDLLQDLAKIAGSNNMEIQSCAEEFDLRPYGIRPGKCVDDEYIQRVFGPDVTHSKDPSQRVACGCVVSKDIGMYDTCLFGCRYCYATTSFERARANYRRHDPDGPAIYS